MQLQPQHIVTDGVNTSTSQHGGPAAAAAQHGLRSMGCGLQPQQQLLGPPELSFQQPARRSTPAAATTLSKAGHNMQLAASWQPAVHPDVGWPAVRLPSQPPNKITSMSAADATASPGAGPPLPQDSSLPPKSHRPQPAASLSPPGPQMTVEAAERLSGSPLLSSLLTALRPPCSPVATSSRTAAERTVRSGKRDSLHGDLDALVAAAAAAVEGGHRGGKHAQLRRLSPQTPDTQPTRL